MIVQNKSNIIFNYVLPDGSQQTDTKDSNIVNTEILSSNITKIKTSNKTFIKEGETAVQTVVITNNSSTTLFAPFFKDTMSIGATYVSGSVVVNGTPQPTFDLTIGFTLPDIAPTKSVTISYTIKADSPLTATPVKNFATFTYTVNDPIKGPVVFTDKTNDVFIVVVSTKITIVKTVDKAFANQGDTLHYTSVITNSGTTKKTNLTFSDPIPTGTTFVNNSVKINALPQAGLNPQTGFPIPDLDVGASNTVEFDVTVN